MLINFPNNCTNKFKFNEQYFNNSLGGDGPKYEIVCTDFEYELERQDTMEQMNYRRARVLCSYDAKDSTELNLVANEVEIKTTFDCKHKI